MSKNIGKSVCKNLSSKCSKKLMEQSATGALKTASKRAIQKTANATGGLTVNKIADKITKLSNNFTTEHIRDSPSKTYYTSLAKKNTPKI